MAKTKKKRTMLLLEVLIALALVVLCVLPLIGPHVDLLRQQKQFVSTMELDRAVNLLYVNLLERMHKNQLPINLLFDKQPKPIDPLLTDLSGINLPHLTGSYQIEEIKHKGKNENGWNVYLLKLTFSLQKQSGEAATVYKFPFELTVIRKISEPPPEDQAAKDNEKNNAPTPTPEGTGDGRVQSKKARAKSNKEAPK